MLKEFKAFIARGNVIDMAVGIIVGGCLYLYCKIIGQQPDQSAYWFICWQN